MSNQGETDDDDYVAPSGLSPQTVPPITNPPQAGEDYDIVEVDDRGNEIGRPPAPQDDRLTQDAGGDQPLIRPDNQEPGQPRERTGVSRRERRERQKNSREAEDRERIRLQGELRTANERLERLESVVATGIQPRIVELGEANVRQQLAGVDQQIADANSAYQDAQRRFTTAMQSADYDGINAAMEARDKAMIARERLTNTKAGIEVGLNKIIAQRGEGRPAQPGGGPDNNNFDNRRPPVQPQGDHLPPRAQEFIRQFKDDNPWFGARGHELDTNIVAAIDKDVMDRGFNPGTQDYWDEVSDMMRERMPHRFGRDDRMTEDRQPQQRQQQPAPQNNRRGGPPVASPGERSPVAAKGRQQVHIGPERKQAMIQSGSIDTSGRVIDDKKYRAQVKKYAEYDASNTSR